MGEPANTLPPEANAWATLGIAHAESAGALRELAHLRESIDFALLAACEQSAHLAQAALHFMRAAMELKREEPEAEACLWADAEAQLRAARRTLVHVGRACRKMAKARGEAARTASKLEPTP